MLFCKKPFEQIYISEAYVKTCPWTNLILGNLLETPIEVLWTNEKAEAIRESIKDGSFRFCRKEECPHCASGMLENMNESEAKAYSAELYPIDINVSYDKFCNHSCPSCRKGVFIPNELYKAKMKTMKNAVLPIVNKTKRLSTCGMGDCFSSPFMMDFIKELNPEDPDFCISFETNGVCLDQKRWEEISNIHKYPINITVTPNSFDRYTYMYLSGGHDNLEKSNKNLKFISELRTTGKISSFKINMVVQESNYREIPSFVEKCLNEYYPDIVQIKPLNKWFCLNSTDYWFKNILNPLHPYHENYLKVMQHPILQHPKVWDWTMLNHDRAPKRHPSMYNEKYTDFLMQLMKYDNRKDVIASKLKEKGISSIAIYGAWKYGEICFELLHDIPELEIRYVIDRNRGDRNLKMCNLDIIGTWQGNCFRDVDAIIISVLSLEKEIEHDLRALHYEGLILTLPRLINDC